jgi:ribosomal protein S18 acetylase RimI-like enzyme
MVVTIRKSTPDDEALLFHLFAENKAHEFALLGMGEEQLRFMLTMQYRARCGGYATDYPNASQQIVEENGKSVGHVLLAEDAASLRIVDIAIAGAHRGRGLGTAALQSLCEGAAATGREVRLQVIPQSPASRLYRRLGFIIVSGDATGEEMVWRSAPSTAQ